MSIEKNYAPLELEKKWYQFWEKEGFFPPKGQGTPYCIMLPPPNVTGTLHMGHAFQDTLMDALIRYHRMQGCRTLWQGGCDHAGIATQMVVEKQLAAQGIDKNTLSREAFIEKIWEWKSQSGNTISQQMRRLGASIDWSRERFTMDEGLSDAVRKTFISLYQEGLIYRGKRLVNWDPILCTAVSDLEVVSQEEEGHLWHIRYPLTSGEGFLIVATTRPETLLGDVAVAVHPQDARYQHLIGQTLQLPLCNRPIPIIGDEFVAQDFGSGCVKITPAHDFNDHAVGKKHHLPCVNIFDKTAHINEQAPPAYQGLSSQDARQKILEDLHALNLLEKTQPHRLMVPRAERTGAIIEPYLTDQWFVKVESLAGPAIQAVQTGKIQFVPENWTQTYFDWMHRIQDWCISRQIWWGHPIPAWYDAQGQVYVGATEHAVRQHYGLADTVELSADPDVLDTWFSSALWPFSTLGWPNPQNELKTYYPTQVLVTGFDIIFFWVARMIMMGLKLVGDVPFQTVFVTGLIQDQEGKKMSKSRGNIIDPLDLIEGITLEALLKKRTFGLMQPQMASQIEKATRKQFPNGIPAFGTDALRFTFCALASTGRHIRFDFARIEGYRHFCNKLWNAARFALMHSENETLLPPTTLGLSERWISSLWQHTKKALHEHFQNYRFDMLTQCLYDFIWNHYCDWYLELAKTTLTDPTCGSRFTLIAILEEVLRALHPLMPFVTEEIWQKLPSTPANSSIMLQAYPQYEPSHIDLQAESQMQLIQNFITAIRTLRAEMNLGSSKPLSVLCKSSQLTAQQIITEHFSTLSSIARLEKITWLSATDLPPLCATLIIEQIEIFIPLAGLIDKQTEIARLSKEMEKLKKDLAFYQNKLKNPDYLNHAPKDIVEKEQARLSSTQQVLAKLEKNFEKISALK